MEFWDISRPLTATPPALDALPGAYRIFAAWNTSTAFKVDGMLAPSATQKQPLPTRVSASFSSSSFWVAQGRATSQGKFQGRTPSANSRPYSAAKIGRAHV